MTEQPGDGDNGDIEQDPHPAARNSDQLAWAVWVGNRRTGECVSVVADSQPEAERKAREQSDESEVRGVDGPYQDAEPAHYEFTFHTEHRETVVVDAPTEEYAKEAADSKRSRRGDYMRTTHTEVRRVPKDGE